MGAAIRYSASSKPLVHLEVEPEPNSKFNQTLPPDTLWLQVSYNKRETFKINNLFLYG